MPKGSIQNGRWPAAAFITKKTICVLFPPSFFFGAVIFPLTVEFDWTGA
jgi:hypothetical protein